MLKRQKKSNEDTAQAETVMTISFASSLLISKQAMAATRVQRVWRNNFSNLLTTNFAQEFLKPGVGATIEYVKSIR